MTDIVGGGMSDKSQLSDDLCLCGHSRKFHKLGCLKRKCSCAVYMTSETRTAPWKLIQWGKWQQPDE